MRNDIVSQAIQYTEVRPTTLFAAANLFAGLQPTRASVNIELTKWIKTGKFSRVVEDFCIDILAKRITFDDAIKGKVKK